MAIKKNSGLYNDTARTINGVVYNYIEGTSYNETIRAAATLTNPANSGTISVQGSKIVQDKTIGTTEGNDWIVGGNGGDTIYAGGGNDVVWGDSSNSSDANDNGEDSLFGEAGNDELHGGNGKDLLDGGADNDKLYGENGVDTLLGGAGNDLLDGGNGSDLLTGGLGADDLIGGLGGDTFIYNSFIESASASSVNLMLANNWNRAAQTGPATPVAGETGDWIKDFQTGEDKLDFRALNPLLTNLAGGAAPLGQLLTFGAPDTPYGVWVTTAGGFSYVNADRNGDGKADLTIRVTGTVGANDFIGVNRAPNDGDETADSTATDDSVAVTGNLLANASDPDSGDTLSVTAGTYTLTYGKLTVLANGTYSYVVTDESIGVGFTGTDTFNYTVSDGHGGTNASTLTIKLVGSNDAATISVVGMPDTSVIEAGGVLNGTPGDPNASGTLAVMDVDAGQAGFGTIGALIGTYGTFTFDKPTGKWTYTLDQTKADVLVANQAVADTLVVNSLDGTVSYSIKVDITGTNDAPTIASGTFVGAVIEDVTPTATGQVVASDVDLTDTLTYSGNATQTYGSFAVDSVTGKWTYTLNNVAAQALDQGVVKTETYTVSVSDGQGGMVAQDVTITITGTEDGPVFAATGLSGTATEAGVGDGEGAAPVPGTAASGDADYTDVDLGDPNDLWVAAAGTTTYGSYTVDTAGKWTYTPNDADPAVNKLQEGGHLEDSFKIEAADGTLQTIKIAVNGTNDAPTTSDDYAEVAATGQLTTNVVANDHDVDSNEATLTIGRANTLNGPTVTTGSGTANGLSIDADGRTIKFDPTLYTVPNTPGATAGFAYLGAGQDAVVRIDYNIKDDQDASSNAVGSPPLGLSYGSLYVTVHGVNDLPVAVDSSDSVDEDGNTFGTLTATDADQNAVLAFSTSAVVEGFVLKADGTWTFDAAGYDSLAEGATLDIDIPFTVTDDQSTTDTGTLKITVTGTNDAPVVSAAQTVAATEGAGSVTANGLANASDVDIGNVLAVTASGALPAGVTLNGNVFTLDANNAAYNSLGAGVVQDVVVNYNVSDGIASTPTSVTFRITGTNDPATLGGTSTGSVTEDAVANTTTGTLTVSDPDTGQSSFVASNASGVYGTFAIGTNGVWTYTLNNTLATTNALNVGSHPTETFAVQSLDGTSTNVVVTVNGANDPAVITGTKTGSVTEDASPNTTMGDLNSTDVDNSPNDAWNAVVSAAASASGYGTYTIDATGHWTYALNNANATVNALNNLGKLTDTFTVTTADGTAQIVTVTIDGHTDAPPYVSPVVFTGGGDPNDFDILGNPLGTTVTGNNNGNLLYGGPGDDRINGNGGDDLIYAGSGLDTVNGNGENDTVYGGSGNDTINGSNDDDILIGGYGADTLTGGQGNDTFRFLSNLDTGDTITDFSSGDKIDLTGVGATTFIGALSSPGAVGAHQFGFINANGNTTIYVDTDGVFGADLEITLSNNYVPVATDFTP